MYAPDAQRNGFAVPFEPAYSGCSIVAEYDVNSTDSFTLVNLNRRAK